jgi:hypothetical protein
MPDIPAGKNKSFLDERVFQHPLFTGQALYLFSPEADQLRTKLADILRASYSLENLNFLEEIYDLNQKRNLSPEQFDIQLKKIENKYIASKSINELNINQDTLEKILKSDNKSIGDYSGAIREVFDLISHNVTSHSTELIQIDKTIVMNNAASYLAGELDKIIQANFKRSSRLFLPKDEAAFIDCQKACANARERLLLFATKPDENKKSIESEKKEFTTILNKAVEALSRNYQILLNFEKTHKNAPVRSTGIEAMIDIISATDKRVNSTSSIQKTQRRDSPIIKIKSILPPLRGSLIFKTKRIKDIVSENPSEDELSKKKDEDSTSRHTKRR